MEIYPTLAVQMGFGKDGILIVDSDMRIMEKCQPLWCFFCKGKKVAIFDEVN